MRPNIDIGLGGERKSRRGAIFWLFLAFLTVIVGLVIWYYDTNPSSPQLGIVRNNITIFVCCVPALILSTIFVVFALFGTFQKKTIVPPVVDVSTLPKCPSCGSVRLNHKLDGRILCNECGYEW